MIIAFMGERKSGKDYFCEHLVQNWGATRLSFSDEVRTLSNKAFRWLPTVISAEVKDEPFIHPNNTFNLTPRQIWLLVARVRDVDPNYFVDSFVKNNAEDICEGLMTPKLYIITDFRTPEEWEFLKRNNIPVVKITRQNRDGIEPDDFEQYVRDFKQHNFEFINLLDGTSRFEYEFKGFINGRS